MSLNKDDKLEVREMILTEISKLFGKEDKQLADRIQDALINAQADRISLTDPEAGERFRRLKPEF